MGEGGIKKAKKNSTSFMDGPLLKGQCLSKYSTMLVLVHSSYCIHILFFEYEFNYLPISIVAFVDISVNTQQRNVNMYAKLSSKGKVAIPWPLMFR